MDIRATLQDLIVVSLRRPQEAARRLIALDLPSEARWTALLLVAVLALLISRVMLILSPGADFGPLFALVSDPWTGAPLQAGSMLLIATAVAVFGRVFGGNGQFMDALLLVVWLQFLLTLAQALQVVALIVFPPLGLLIAIASLGLFLWLLVSFIAALHGFSDLGKVLAGTMASFVVVVIILSFILILFGIVIPMEGAADV